MNDMVAVLHVVQDMGFANKKSPRNGRLEKYRGRGRPIQHLNVKDHWVGNSVGFAFIAFVSLLQQIDSQALLLIAIEQLIE